MALCLEIPIGFKMAKQVIHISDLRTVPQRHNDGDRPASGRLALKRKNRQDEADEDDMGDDHSHQTEKKRRLSIEQVRFLEMSFEMENKLEPERKSLIAKRLGLKPRQVAIWFQNRRARWKTKQLEHDYDTLKAEYNTVLKEKEKLQAEVARLTALLPGSDNEEGGISQVVDGAPAADNPSRKKPSQPLDPWKKPLQPDDSFLFSTKSEICSPTKSDESEVQNSGRYNPLTLTTVEVAPEGNAEINMYPVLKVEDSVICSPEEFFGNVYNPSLFQHLALKLESGYCPEEACNILVGWDEQTLFPWE